MLNPGSGNFIMTSPKEVKQSKFLSLILRHKPEIIGLTLDSNGWADTQALIQKANAANFGLTLDQLKTIVANNDKKRFVFSEDYSRIRANQGHSLPVDLQLKEETPPAYLYHGTADKNISSIKNQGLLKGQRHHVHLSADPETARKVGRRSGKPVILIVKAGLMYQNGYKFYLSENKVWLTDFVTLQFLIFPV